MGRSALVEEELDGIAAVLQGSGYKVLFGYKNRSRHTIFYNDSGHNPVHSLHFSSCNLEGKSVWELLGGFIAYPICEGDQECKEFYSIHFLGIKPRSRKETEDA